jgi:G protein-coupled receptor 157
MARVHSNGTRSSRITQQVVMTTSSFSLVGSALICLVFALFPSLRTPARHLLVCLSICDMMLDGTMISTAVWSEGAPTAAELETFVGSVFCGVQGILGSVGSLGYFVWQNCLAWHVLRSVRCRRDLGEGLHFRVYHVLAWGTMVAVACVLSWGYQQHPSWIGSTGEPWCFIPQTQPNWMLLRLAIVYIPLWLSWLFCSLCYFLTWTELRNMKSDKGGAPHSAALEWKFIAVPVFFVLLRIPGTIHRVADMAHFRTGQWLHIGHAACDTLQGTLNCLLFIILTPQVRSAMKDSLVSHACCCCWFRSRRREYSALGGPPREGTPRGPKVTYDGLP